MARYCSVYSQALDLCFPGVYFAQEMVPLRSPARFGNAEHLPSAQRLRQLLVRRIGSIAQPAATSGTEHQRLWFSLRRLVLLSRRPAQRKNCPRALLKWRISRVQRYLCYFQFLDLPATSAAHCHGRVRRPRTDLPALITPGARLPALRQIHVGAGVDDKFISWRDLPMLGIRELTLTPATVHPVLEALASCTNISRLTLVMATFVPEKHETLHSKTQIRRFVDALSLVPELCFSEISIIAHEKFVLTNFDDRRFRHLTLDYMGRARRPGSSWYLSLPSPCDALADPVQLILKLRDGVYKLAVVDSDGLRREIFLDRDTIRMAPGLWNCYLKKKKIVQRATVDAAAWSYFSDGLPEPCAIPELDIVVVQHSSELQAVSLSRFTDLERLRIDVAKPGMKFDSAAVQKLVRSRGGQGDEEPLATLLLSPNATYVGDMTRMAAVVNFV